MTYRIHWLLGATETHATYDAAVARIRAVMLSPVIGHPGDLLDGGKSTLVWADETRAWNDDGRRAAARIVLVESETP